MRKKGLSWLIIGLMFGSSVIFSVIIAAPLPEERLSPRIRSTPLDSIVERIPTQYLRAFLEQSKIIDEQTFKKAPCVIAHDQDRIFSSAGDKIYVKGLASTNQTRFSLYESGISYCDPNSKEILGFEAEVIGEAELLAQGELSVLRIISSKKEINTGTKILPAEPIALPYTYEIAYSPFDLEGEILSVKKGLVALGQYQVAVINLGTMQGLEEGEQLSIFQQLTYNGQLLPENKIGRVLIFKTYEKVSLGLVIDANNVIHLKDKVRS